jgi:hypothetical protein
MPEVGEWLELARREFELLCTDHGFERPTTISDAFQPSLLYRRGKLGIEIEFDWREKQVYVLIVNMEHGEPPPGYMSGGRRIRAHLQRVIPDKEWKDGLPSRTRRPPSMEDQIRTYKRMISAHMRDIVAEAERLFE